MKRSEHAYTLPVPVARVQAVVLDEAFQLALAQARDDVQSAELLWIEPGRVFELRAQEYGRTRTGGIDRSRTTLARTRYRWDATSLHLSWEWSGHEKRISLTGGVRLEAQGQSTRIHTYRNVEVRLPLIGGRIERIIDKEFAASDGSYRSIMREHLGI